MHVPLFPIVRRSTYNYTKKILENYFCCQVFPFARIIPLRIIDVIILWAVVIHFARITKLLCDYLCTDYKRIAKENASGNCFVTFPFSGLSNDLPVTNLLFLRSKENPQHREQGSSITLPNPKHLRRKRKRLRNARNSLTGKEPRKSKEAIKRRSVFRHFQ